MNVHDADKPTAFFVIRDAMRKPGRGMIDPITVLLRDFAGSGQIIVECYGAAWSAWFGSIGAGSFASFIATCDEQYLAGKLVSVTCRRTTKNEESYVQDICRAVIEAVEYRLTNLDK